MYTHNFFEISSSSSSSFFSIFCFFPPPPPLPLSLPLPLMLRRERERREEGGRRSCYRHRSITYMCLWEGEKKPRGAILARGREGGRESPSAFLYTLGTQNPSSSFPSHFLSKHQHEERGREAPIIVWGEERSPSAQICTLIHSPVRKEGEKKYYLNFNFATQEKKKFFPVSLKKKCFPPLSPLKSLLSSADSSPPLLYPFNRSSHPRSLHPPSSLSTEAAAPSNYRPSPSPFSVLLLSTKVFNVSLPLLHRGS